jgi:hypothetical protein
MASVTYGPSGTQLGSQNGSGARPEAILGFSRPGHLSADLRRTFPCLRPVSAWVTALATSSSENLRPMEVTRMPSRHNA